jgi:GNAT superfamily N-acetyltransferase
VCYEFASQYGVLLDTEAVINKNMASLDVFLPPQGAFLLSFDGGSLAGCACMRGLGPGVAELKRMYGRPGHRRKGIGAQLVSECVRRAEEAGYFEIWLESAGFMTDANSLYRKLGFSDAEPCEQGSSLGPTARTCCRVARRTSFS